MTAATTARASESVRKAAALFNSLLTQGEDALAPYRSPDYQAPCRCGDEREKHTGPLHTGSCTGCGKASCGRYAESMVHVRVHDAVMGMDAKFSDVMRRQRREDYAKRPRPERKPGEWIVRFSDVGGCGRQIGYRNFHPELAVPTYDGPALAGDVVEQAVQRVDRRAFPWRVWQREVRHPAIPRPGRIDWWDPVLGMVCDIKSAGDWKWEQATVFGTLIENLMQVCLYALALELEGVQVNFVRIHYIHRDNLEESFEPHTYRWDDKMRAVAQQALVELAGRRGQLDITEITGELPERDRLGPTDGLCRNCEFLAACWNTERAAELNRTPESLTLLGEKPDDAAIEHVGKRIVAKRREIARLKREYDAENNMIDLSVKPGDYGAVRIKKSSHGFKVRTSEYIEALCHKIELLGGDPGEVPIPRGGPGLPVAELVPIERQKKAERARAARVAAETEDGTG